MIYREIDEAAARRVLKILVEECGYTILDPRDGDSFVRQIVTTDKDWQHMCSEYRFQGALGFGGKFRNNGNHNNTPYVDCYQEDETPARREMIENANFRFKELFA